MIKKHFSIFIFFLTIFISGFLIFKSANAQSASLLPNGVQQFFDNSGNPLSSGKIYFYQVGTSTFKDTYTSSAATTINTNPITLNAGGKASTGGIYGIGLYRQLVKDRNGNIIWDAVTAPGGSGGGTQIGDGNLVGTILSWSGLVAPNQYQFAYGQELSRVTYPELYTAITQTLNVSCSNGSNTITALSDTTQIKLGSAVELICVAAGTTVVSKTSSTVLLSNPSNITLNAAATFFPFGNGDGATSFNVPDLRGNTVAGRPNMGGTAASNLTSTYFGTDPDALGAVGGSENYTIAVENVPPLPVRGGGGANVVSQGGSGLSGAGASAGPDTSTVANPGVTPSPFAIIQPTLTLNYIIKVTPDTNTSSTDGVASIGGMTGVIACGTGILCTGNIISATGLLAGGANTNVQYNSSGAFGGTNNFTWVDPKLTIGLAGTATGQLGIAGATSGNVTQTVQSAAGTPTVTWGTSSGTPAVTASAPLSLTTATGNISITGLAGGVLAGATPAFTRTPTLGASGTLGSLSLGNATSGLVTLQPVAGALGTVTVSIPSAAGTMAVSASSPLALDPTTGALTCTGCLTNTPAALTKTDDTNVTLTLGGTPATALLQATSLTLGWTGTLAAARLNSNVVQAITNDTNITGSITAQNLTLGWTGTLAAARLNANVVQSIVNDTNVTGSIATQALTLGWTGQLAINRGGTGQATAAAARASTGLNIESLHTTGDADVSISATTRTEQTTTTFTAQRTWTLPAANAVNAGQSLIVSDKAGAINGLNTLVVARSGADTINGASSVNLSTQYAQITFISNGSDAWTYNPASSGSGSGTVTQVDCGNTSIISSGTCYSPGQIVGTNTNDAATAGNFGEYTASVIASGSAVGAGGSNNPFNVTSISLTAGDWNVSGTITYVANGTWATTSVRCSISQTSATLDTTADRYGIIGMPTATIPQDDVSVPCGPVRISLAGTTTIYLVGLSLFSASTTSGYGALKAWRAR